MPFVAPVVEGLGAAIGIGGGEAAAGTAAAGLAEAGAGTAAAKTAATTGARGGIAATLKKGAIFGTGSHIAQGVLGGSAAGGGAASGASPTNNIAEASVLNPTQFN